MAASASVTVAVFGNGSINAVRMAVTAYKEEMDRVAGPKCNDHLSNIELEKEHARNFLRSQAVFDSVANFGSSRRIEEARELFIQSVESDFNIYQCLNEGRNPLAGWET